MIPAEDIDAARASGPLRTGYDVTDIATLPRLVEALGSHPHVRISRAGARLDIRAAGGC